MTTLSPKLKVGHSWRESLDRDSERGHNGVSIDGNQNLFDSTNLFMCLIVVKFPPKQDIGQTHLTEIVNMIMSESH